MLREPTLAAKTEQPSVQALLPYLKNYPYWMSPKIDGFRGFVGEGKRVDLFARSLDTHANLKTREHFAKPELLGIDGELVVGMPFGEGVFARTSSGLRTVRFDPQAVFYVFDDFTTPDEPFHKRYAKLQKRVAALHKAGIRIGIVPQEVAKGPKDIIRYNEECLRGGYEGIMIRNPNAPYLFGRATLLQDVMFKLKPREDFEAVCVDYYEMQTNSNVATTNARGRSQRSSAAAGKTGKGTLGGLLCRTLDTKVEFNVGNGPGLTAKMRDYLWSIRKTLPGELIKCTKLPIGEIDKPRSPLFAPGQFNMLGIRPKSDMS